MTFTLEVYGRDEQHLGTVVLQDRYAKAILEGEAYPFRNVESACMALLAWNNAREREQGRASGKPPIGDGLQ